MLICRIHQQDPGTRGLLLGAAMPRALCAECLLIEATAHSLDRIASPLQQAAASSSSVPAPPPRPTPAAWRGPSAQVRLDWKIGHGMPLVIMALPCIISHSCACPVCCWVQGTCCPMGEGAMQNMSDTAFEVMPVPLPRHLHCSLL